MLLSPKARSIPIIKFVVKMPATNDPAPRIGRLLESNTISGNRLSEVIEVLSIKAIGVKIRIIVFIRRVPIGAVVTYLKIVYFKPIR